LQLRPEARRFRQIRLEEQAHARGGLRGGCHALGGEPAHARERLHAGLGRHRLRFAGRRRLRLAGRHGLLLVGGTQHVVLVDAAERPVDVLDDAAARALDVLAGAAAPAVDVVADAAADAVAMSRGEASTGGRSPGPPAASTSPGAPISAMTALTGTVVPAWT